MPTVSFNQHFPGYEILGELSRSNARVLKARNQLNDELVAIKHFNLGTDKETIKRFQRESEIMMAVQHPNIVKIREIRLEAELPYIVMDYIEGGDLRFLLKEKGKLTASDIIRLGLQMIQAFTSIHEKGIIHRDIKPENIMFRELPSGELHFLLSDFGVAKLREQSNTMTGASLLTYEYASPEQFLDPRSITTATDYYSLGIVLYECVCGKAPFLMGEDGVYPFTQKVIHSAPAELRLKGVPRQLNELIRGLLAKKQEQRIKDPLTVASMLKLADLGETTAERTTQLSGISSSLTAVTEHKRDYNTFMFRITFALVISLIFITAFAFIKTGLAKDIINWLKQ
jgi:serine/threonine protein kinase